MTRKGREGRESARGSLVTHLITRLEALTTVAAYSDSTGGAAPNLPMRRSHSTLMRRAQNAPIVPIVLYVQIDVISHNLEAGRCVPAQRDGWTIIQRV